MTAREFLAAVQQRADAATDGPWSVYNRGVGHEVHWSGAHDDGVAFKASLFDDDATRRSDAEFIAAARTDVPRLVAFALAVLNLADDLWKFEGENTDRAEGKAAAAAAIRHLAEHALTPKENDS